MVKISEGSIMASAIHIQFHKTRILQQEPSAPRSLPNPHLGVIYHTPMTRYKKKGLARNYYRTKQKQPSLIISPQNCFHHIRQWPVKVLARLKIELFNEQYVMLEARVHMRVKTKRHDNRVVVAIDVRVHAK